MRVQYWLMASAKALIIAKERAEDGLHMHQLTQVSDGGRATAEHEHLST